MTPWNHKKLILWEILTKNVISCDSSHFAERKQKLVHEVENGNIKIAGGASESLNRDLH